jgi:hypothetical protein
MPLDYVGASSPPSHGLRDNGPIELIGSEPDCTSPLARAALAAADVVFCDENADRDILRLVAPGALVELVSGDGGRDPTRALSISRARKLAGDGWRVVWITSAQSVGSAADLGDVGHPIAGADDISVAAAEAYQPHAFATALNGLAG